VPAGSAQTPYGCAPWVAQVLAAGGFIPGQSGCSDISNFSDVDGYNLNWVDCDGTGIIGWLQSQGWVTTSTITQGTVCAVTTEDYCDHAVLGVGDGLCAAHNNARWAVDCGDGFYGTPDICVNPPAR
jgi:hypothetical protein